MHTPSLVLTTIVALALAACGQSADPVPGAASTPVTAASGAAPSATPSSSMADAASPGQSAPGPATPSTTAVAGAYLDLAAYEKQMSDRSGTRVVYFFHAPWCPDCRATDASLKSEGVPQGLTVVKVDFDSMTDLRRQLGVTQQHTFVQVDSAGSQVKKWSGSRTGAAISAQTVQG